MHPSCQTLGRKTIDGLLRTLSTTIYINGRKILKRYIVLVAAILMAGCAFHQQPYVAHDGGLPMSGTSVFSVVTENAAVNGALEILEVDGRSTSCIQVGCPVWVRVAPGKHKFKLRFNGNFTLSAGFINWKTATFTAEVADMKPLHVYHGQHRLSLGAVQVNVQDLGERPRHGIWLGLEGANRKYYPVEF